MNKLLLVALALSVGACATAQPTTWAPQPLTQAERDMVARRNAISNSEPVVKRKDVLCDNWCREWQLNRALYDIERAVHQPIIVPVYYPVYRRW